jgi:hypothetical protein
LDVIEMNCLTEPVVADCTLLVFKGFLDADVIWTTERKRISVAALIWSINGRIQQAIDCKDLDFVHGVTPGSSLFHNRSGDGHIR